MIYVACKALRQGKHYQGMMLTEPTGRWSHPQQYGNALAAHLQQLRPQHLCCSDQVRVVLCGSLELGAKEVALSRQDLGL